MDTREFEETLGNTGLVGLAVLVVGFLIVARENRRTALGAAAIVVGHWLVSHGIVGSFLESLGMSYEDL